MILQGLPRVIAENVHLRLDEVAYMLYMPVCTPGVTLALPPQAEPFVPLLHHVMLAERERVFAEYMYLTVKRMIVGPTVTPNRPGWHADGFGTDDLNFVWYDCVPTVFNRGAFDVSEDHTLSLQQFDQQADPSDDVTFPTHTLLRLDPTIVHRVAMADREQMRTFVKITISKNRFNLIGNSRNHAAPGLDWPMYPREAVRNDPHRAQLDFHNPKDDHYA